MARAYTLGAYEKAMPGDLNWKEKMLAAKEADFDFIEISIDETDAKLARLDMSGEERLELVSLMRETESSDPYDVSVRPPEVSSGQQ